MGTPMECFFDGADMVVKAMATSAPTAAQVGPAEPLILSAELVPIDEGTHEGTQKEATPLAAFQTEVVFLTTPLIISTSDPFTALSQAMKNGSSLLVTPSSIPNSTTRGPDANLSSEGSKEVLEDSNNEPAMKKMISDSDKEEGGDRKA